MLSIPAFPPSLKILRIAAFVWILLVYTQWSFTSRSQLPQLVNCPKPANGSWHAIRDAVSDVRSLRADNDELVSAIAAQMDTWFQYNECRPENQFFLVNETENTSSELLPNCSITSSRRILALNKTDLLRPASQLLELKPLLHTGGHYFPGCNPGASSNVALIIPYRDRAEHLTNFLAYLLPILMEQRVEFRVILAEQMGQDLFNKGRLMNAGVQYAMALNEDIDCFIFHDVDLLPQSNYQRYDCQKSPYHFTPFFDELGFTLYADYLMGGGTGVSKNHFLAANGWSNLFWGYGGEDEEFGRRLQSRVGPINRGITPEFGSRRSVSPAPVPYRYLMLPHRKRTFASGSHKRLTMALINSAAKRFAHDGFYQKLWKIDRVDITNFYHRILVDVGPSPQYP